MKKMQIMLVILSLVLISQSLMADELQFKSGTWDEIKSLAKQENKIIFLDAYTDWCGWCKVLDKETFTDKQVIDFVNANFIPVKYEMETGFGQTLAMKYRVRGFPSQLFFNPDGSLIYVSFGYRPPTRFLELLKTALKTENHFNLKGVSNKIDMDFPSIYKGIFVKNESEVKKKFPTVDETVAYLDGQDDLFSEVNYAVLSAFELNEKYNTHFLENIEKYEELFGNYSTDEKLYSIVYANLQPAIEEKSEQKLDEVLILLDKYDTKNAKKNKEFYRFQFYKKTHNWVKYSEFVEDKIKSGEVNDDNINEYSWTIYENCDDGNTLKKAVNWIKPVIERNPNYMNVDTYAALLFKTNDLPNAKKYAEEAIKLGLAEKQQVKETEALLEKINEKMK